MIALERAIEVAEHNGWYENDGATLVVWDSLQTTPYGTRLRVYPGATAVGGYCAEIHDGVGKGCNVWLPSGDKLDACKAVLDGYLQIVNHGI